MAAAVHCRCYGSYTCTPAAAGVAVLHPASECDSLNDDSVLVAVDYAVRRSLPHSLAGVVVMPIQQLVHAETEGEWEE